MEQQELYWLTLVAMLTGLIWMPYILERISRIGLLQALGLAPVDEQKYAAVPAWAARMMKAHANAVENLVVFAPLAILVAMLGLSNPTTQLAAMVYFFTRLAHLVVYVFNIPVFRTLTFAVGFFCQMALGLTILGML